MLEHLAGPALSWDMAFHFKRKEPVAGAVRRLCRRRIEAALKSLEGRNRVKAVHNVRREIKKLRAILRLMRGEIGKGAYRRSVNTLRAAADRLTSVRDAHIRLQAFEALTSQYKRRVPARPFPEIKRALRRNCRMVERTYFKNHSVVKLKKILRKAGRQVGGLKIKSDGWAAIAPGLEKGYRRGRAALAMVRVAPSPEHFHDWRKRVKELWHQIRLLRSMRPKELGVAANELESLGELLGDDHDLFMLQVFLAGKFKNKEAADGLDELIRARQQGLHSVALELGANCYSENPDVFRRRLGNYWHRWRRAKTFFRS
jgi:CHAD domain-containing protein